MWSQIVQHATSIKLPAYERYLRIFDGIKKTPVLKREELYQGLIEPGWGAGLLNPALREESGSVQLRTLPIRLLLRSIVSYPPVS
jgi:hypothetical protein